MLWTLARPLHPLDEGAVGMVTAKVVEPSSRESRDGPVDGALVTLEDARREIEHLRRALVTRTVIGQAIGILMERRRITAEEAFEELKNASQRANVKLAQIAEDLTETGEWPTSALAPRVPLTRPAPTG